MPDGHVIFHVALPETSEKDLSNIKDELALLGEVSLDRTSR